MYMILHNLKVAVRNLMKYKLQTAISVVCIAVGIVTLSLAHSYLNNFQLSALYELPYSDRIYNLTFKSQTSGEKANINMDIVRALKKRKGIKNIDQVALPTAGQSGARTEFHLPDSTLRKGLITTETVDPDFLALAGYTSAITGKKITDLKRGEAIIGEKLAEQIFGSTSPIGSVQQKIGPVQPIPIRIVDVYKSIPSFDRFSSEDEVLFSLADKIEDQDIDLFFLIPWINIVKKDRSSEVSFLQEINEIVKPYGVEADLEKTFKDEDIRSHYSYKLLIYLIGSLVLIAAIIGYLRTQIQLFWMRRSEMSLRIVNGAHKRQLFGMLVVEATLTIVLSIIVAVILGFLLQDFFNSNKDLFSATGIIISNLWLFSIEIGGLLIIFSSLIAWLTLDRISKSENGLVKNMRGGNNHLFRNSMLCIQMIVCMIIISSTLLLVRAGHNMLKSCNIPENDDLYSECLTMRTDIIEDPDRIERVFQGISELPECDRIVLFDPYFSSIEDIRNSPEAMEKFNNKTYYRSYKTTDKEAPILFGMEVEWFPKNVEHNECILVGETLYRNLTEVGLLSDNTMTISCAGPIHSLTLPIAGIIKNAPYEKDTDCIVAISKYWEEIYSQYTLIPKKGKGKTFAKSVENALIKYDPENLNNSFMLHNYRDFINETPSVVSAVYVGCVILAIVSLLICAMSIFSAVALDTRSRKKEVAIRKVNGAKNKDIYKVIGVQYVVVLGLSLLVAIPASIWFQHVIEPHLGNILDIGNVSPVMPIVLGSLLVIVLVALIVFLQIRKILQIDTSKIIAKE